jgi:hypothetical protein
VFKIDKNFIQLDFIIYGKLDKKDNLLTSVKLSGNIKSTNFNNKIISFRPALFVRVKTFAGMDFIERIAFELNDGDFVWLICSETNAYQKTISTTTTTTSSSSILLLLLLNLVLLVFTGLSTFLQ